MSKKLARLLGAVLVVMLAFSAAFAAAPEGTKLGTMTINLDAGKTGDSVSDNNVNVLTGNEVTVLTFSAAGAATASVAQAEEAAALELATVNTITSPTKVSITAEGVFSAEGGTLAFNDAGKLTFTADEGDNPQPAVLTFSAAGAATASVAQAEEAAALELATVNTITSPTKVSITAEGVFSAEGGTLAFNEENKLVFTSETDVPFILAAGQQIKGDLYAMEVAAGEEQSYIFYAAANQKLVGSDDTEATANDVEVNFGESWFPITSPDGIYTLNVNVTAAKTKIAAAGELGEATEVEYDFTGELIGSEAVEAVGAAFDSADITVFADGKDMGTVKFTSADAKKSVTVSTDVTVSFDLSEVSFDLVSVDGKGKTSTDLKAAAYVFSTDIEDTSKDVYIYFTSGDASFEAKLTISVDASSSGTTTTETYLLKVSDITITPANAVTNTAKLISADTDNYSATLDLANLDSTASGDWGSFAEFTASSDYLGGSFSVTVSTDAKLVNVYVKNGTTWDEVDTEEVSGKVITPNTIGTYKVVLSADLIASSDKKVSGDAYFAFDFKVVSVDAAKSEEAAQDVVTDAANASADATGGVGGNPIISAGQKIDTKFLSGTSISASAFASFFSSATTVTMLSETELAAALETLGLDEDDMGDSENGYKALAFGLPSGFTLTANEKFFVLLTTNENGTGTNRLGVGVVSPKLNGSRTMVIVFKLLKNPAHTADFMTFDAGEYFVGATNDTASADTSSSTRAVFVTAGGTFNIKSDEATLLQGQTASGTATPYEGDDDDDDNQETSSHGSSSGCDAGFGALALLAVAGALAARKVRK